MTSFIRCVLPACWCAVIMSMPVLAQETKTPSAADSVAVLQDSGASAFDKAKACQRLATVGNDDAVPALAALLDDEQLNAYARSALEAIATPAADEALRNATRKLGGRPLIGVLLSLGNRRDAEAVPLLVQYLDRKNAEVAAAAAAALGDIGTPAAAAALMQARSQQHGGAPWLAQASLECADQLAATDRAAANDLYERLMEGPVPKHVQLAAMLGQFRLMEKGQAKWLIEQLQNDDRDYFNLGLAAAREASGDGVTAALVKELHALEPNRRALLLRALSDRADAIPLATLLDQSQSDSPAVQVAAVEILAHSKSPQAAAELVNIALGDGDAAQVAAKQLTSLESDAVDLAIGQRLDQPGPSQLVLIDLVGQRRMEGLKPQLIALLDSPELATRCAALGALGQVAELDDLDLLLDRAFSDAPEAETKASQDAVRTAAMRMSDREACAARLVDRLSSSSPEQQQFLLTRLREIGGRTALEAVGAHAKSSDPALKDAATRELGAWPTADAAPALLDLAQNDPESKYQIRALRGYLRIARQLQLPDEERTRFFHTALETAQRDQEQQLAFDVLARMPTVPSLQLATSHLDDAALREAAAEAALTIAGKLVTSDPAAVKTAMQQVLAAGVSEKLAERARAIAGKTGVASD